MKGGGITPPLEHDLPKRRAQREIWIRISMRTAPYLSFNDPLSLHGDEAKRSISEDEFGLARMVEAFADTLTSRLMENGYVVGVEGKWGSGKSTFVNFVAERIRGASPNHHVIRFEPWLIGARDSLLSHFFGLLAAKIDSLDDAALDVRSSYHER
jgi:hypothetical protein